MKLKDAIEAVGCREFVRRPADRDLAAVRVVALSAACTRGFDKCAPSAKSQLLRTMEDWCDGKPLPGGKYKTNEGRYSRGDNSILLQALASPGTRFYGYIDTIDGVEIFFFTQYDLNKKNQKADQDLLKLSAKYCLAILLKLIEVKDV